MPVLQIGVHMNIRLKYFVMNHSSIFFSLSVKVMVGLVPISNNLWLKGGVHHGHDTNLSLGDVEMHNHADTKT